jgi:hypothetical protein
MKKLASLLLIGCLSVTHQVFAHGDHAHAAITETEALGLAQKTATMLTKKDSGLGFGKLPASWSGLPTEKMKMHKSGNGYYIVSATNSAEAKTLYVLMSSEGEVYDANFTGEFKNLEQ